MATPFLVDFDDLTITCNGEDKTLYVKDAIANPGVIQWITCVDADAGVSGSAAAVGGSVSFVVDSGWSPPDADYARAISFIAHGLLFLETPKGINTSVTVQPGEATGVTHHHMELCGVWIDEWCWDDYTEQWYLCGGHWDCDACPGSGPDECPEYCKTEDVPWTVCLFPTWGDTLGTSTPLSPGAGCTAHTHTNAAAKPTPTCCLYRITATASFVPPPVGVDDCNGTAPEFTSFPGCSVTATITIDP